MDLAIYLVSYIPTLRRKYRARQVPTAAAPPCQENQLQPEGKPVMVGSNHRGINQGLLVQNPTPSKGSMDVAEGLVSRFKQPCPSTFTSNPRFINTRPDRYQPMGTPTPPRGIHTRTGISGQCDGRDPFRGGNLMGHESHLSK